MTTEAVAVNEMPVSTDKGTMDDDAVSLGEDGPTYAELMNGTVGAQFFGDDVKQKWHNEGRDKDGVRVPFQGGDSPQGWDHDEVLPLPSRQVIRQIKKERDAAPAGAKPEDMGPVTKKWYAKVRIWLQAMRDKYQPDRAHVTGSWRKNWKAWNKRLRRLPEKRRKYVMRLLMQGVELPFDKRPSGPLRKLKNHPQLGEKSDVVWNTIAEMLAEGSVVPHDCQGRHDEDVLPQGMFSIRWVQKGDSEKVRITINMRPLNAYLLSVCSTVELATLHKITSLWQRHDEQITLDMHSSYYHLHLNEEASDWSGFSVADSELPEAAVLALRNGPATSCCRWRDRWIFRYKGMAMGCSPSAARYCECADALIDVWKQCTVGRAVKMAPKSIRATGYIDDSLFLVQGFARGLELGLRVALEYIICGFWINLDKSCVLPSKRPCYLGCIVDSVAMRFSLTTKRCSKIRKAVHNVREQVEHSGRISMKTLAVLVGNLWSVHVVCRRAVAIMYRSLIAILASELRHPWLLHEKDPFRLKNLLKRVWSGDAPWSQAAEEELCFWERVDFEALWAPMRQWDLFPDARDCLLNPRSGGLHPSVKVFAADSSDFASGGAEFVVVDNCLQRKHNREMVISLSIDALKQSSTFKELEGLCKLDFALVGRTCRRVFFLVDNVAAMRIILRGSKLECLNFFAKLLFLRSLKMRRLLCPLWFRRDNQVIEVVDESSRLKVSADFALPMSLFWRANTVARELWGKGFQFDRFASTSTVMPMDCKWRLPFNSQFWQPMSSGRDALKQDWRRIVNWVNAPFCLLDQVLGLLKLQHAVAAVLVPRGSAARWDSEVRPGRAGYCGEITFNPRLKENTMIGRGRNEYKGLYAIVFVDFRTTSSGLLPLRSADELRNITDTADLGRGCVMMSRMTGSLSEAMCGTTHSVPVPANVR